jgi:hypothetical protein
MIFLERCTIIMPSTFETDGAAASGRVPPEMALTPLTFVPGWNFVVELGSVSPFFYLVSES